MNDLLPVLSSLMSPDNNLRRNAENFYQNQLENNLEFVVDALLTVFTNGSLDLVVRSFAGVLLRRAVEQYSEKLSQDSNNALRSKLMGLWSREKNKLILQRLSHVLAQSAFKVSWPDLVPSLVDGAGALHETQLVSVLGLLEIITDYCPDDISAHLTKIGGFLSKFLSNADPAVQVACAKTTVACIVCLEDDSARNSFKPAIEPIISVLGQALNRSDEVNATSIMENLVDIAQIQPNFFKGVMDGVVGAMLAVAGSQQLDFSTRSMALELMVTLTETAPALARRCPALAQGLIPLAMSLMLEVEEEDADWAKGKYLEEAANDENCCVGDEAIERVAAGMGGKTVFEPILAMVQQFIGHREWPHRRAAVAAIGRLAEGSPKQFEKYLSSSLGLLVAACQDSAHRVKYEAIQTIGRFAALYQNDTNTTLVETFAPFLIQTLQDPGSCDQVRGHAASALINLINPACCEPLILEKFVDPLLTALVFCLQHASMEVRAPCLVVIGCVAQVSRESFACYYGAFMPGIKSIMQHVTSPDHAVLRGKAMECAGLVGQAVGVAVFAADAMEIIELFVHAIRNDTGGDITFDYVLPACARISKALGSSFEPFLQVVMEPLLAGASQDIKFSMVDAAEEDIEGEVIHDEENGTESAVVSLGAGIKKRVTLNTHAVQQKNQAARIMFEFAKSLGKCLKQGIMPCLEVLLGLVASKHSADIRSSASLALSKMFQAYIEAVKAQYLPPTQLEEIANVCAMKLLDSIHTESDLTARACAVESLRDILSHCYNSGVEDCHGVRHSFQAKLAFANAEIIVREVLLQCAECVVRRADKEAFLSRSDTYDSEDVENKQEEIEEEEELLTNLTDTVGQLLKMFHDQLMPIFDKTIAPAFAPYLALPPQHAVSMRVIAVCMVDDAIEFGGAPAAKYVPSLINVFLHNVEKESDLVIRQCSVYGLSKCLMVAPAVCVQQLNRILPALLKVVQEKEDGDEADEDDNEEMMSNQGLTDNAAYGIGCILANQQYREALLQLHPQPAPIVGLWLSKLPLDTDEVISKSSLTQLCDIIERKDPILQFDGAFFAAFFRTVLAVAESLQKAAEAEQRIGVSLGDDDEIPFRLAHEQTVGRLQAFARSFAASGQAVVHQMLQALEEASQEAIKAFIA